MKNLLKITLASLLFVSVSAFSQETIIPEIKYADLEKYIDLAKQNYPKLKLTKERSEGIKTNIPIAALGYLDMFSGSYFYRPQKQAVLDPVNPYSVNGFQFGVTVSLGTLISRPLLIKRAKSDYKAAKLEEKDYENQLVLLVKSRYYDYIQSINLLKLSAQLASDNKGVAESLRLRFEKSEITLDVYNQSRILQFNAYQAKIAAETTFLKSKDLLEEVIGAKLADVK
ncbi:TolC family protein [Pedobacter aquatilis]|uniref:TolC family protein n=1 Tax=Pedobacter aquatilis TaxID=351343 RepID=UPI00292ECC10|nr:TolC family protein [Pedobacter aquatilis]